MTRDQLKEIAAGLRDLPGKIDRRELRAYSACDTAGALLAQAIELGVMDSNPMAKARVEVPLSKKQYHSALIAAVDSLFPSLDHTTNLYELALGCPALADWLDNAPQEVADIETSPDQRLTDDQKFILNQFKTGERLKKAELAARTGHEPDSLNNVCASLVQRGYLISHAGRNGGYERTTKVY